MLGISFRLELLLSIFRMVEHKLISIRVCPQGTKCMQLIIVPDSTSDDVARPGPFVSEDQTFALVCLLLITRCMWSVLYRPLISQDAFLRKLSHMTSLEDNSVSSLRDRVTSRWISSKRHTKKMLDQGPRTEKTATRRATRSRATSRRATFFGLIPF